MEQINFVVLTAEFIGVAVLAIIYIRSRIPKETITQQGLLIEALQKRLDESIEENKQNLERYRENERIMAEKHLQNERAIADLQGQIKVYKELPLQDIAKSLKALEVLPKEFDRISKQNTKQLLKAVKSHSVNIKEQHVKNQTVDNETVSSKQ